MTCEAKLHGWVTQMARPMVTHIGGLDSDPDGPSYGHS